jgi:hypothetical protein
LKKNSKIIGKHNSNLKVGIQLISRIIDFKEGKERVEGDRQKERSLNI